MQSPQKVFPPQVTQALERGDLMGAIKLLRASGFGLKEAKDALDAHVRASRPGTTDMKQRFDAPAPDDASKIVSQLSPGQVRGMSEGAWLAIAIVIGVMVALFITGGSLP
ncbi:MAG: hypothetical protein V4684_00310 [Pseudomonadota bacterium]